MTRGKPSTIITKCSILDVEAVLDPPLMTVSSRGGKADAEKNYGSYEWLLRLSTSSGLKIVYVLVS